MSTGTPTGATRPISLSFCLIKTFCFSCFFTFFIIRLAVPFSKLPALSAFLILDSVFLPTRLFFSSRSFSHGSCIGSSFFFTSRIGQDSGPAFALLSRDPVRCFHSPVASSNTLRDCFPFGAISRWRANCSHLVSCLGGGGGNIRGNLVSAVGSLANSPKSVFSVGNFHNSRSNCVVPSAALTRSIDSLTGFGSAEALLASIVGGLSSYHSLLRLFFMLPPRYSSAAFT
mmetsp:Transcript_18283/g.30892  ORF Transcript_18283/g.30892 Transcript_18283/m.30892 type:complete len:229 (-) Transcript_18283:379-1065(-)